MKIYKNPHNGEIVQTKGGNHAPPCVEGPP
ncbi:hypothetical protein [Pseudomonas graminis]